MLRLNVTCQTSHIKYLKQAKSDLTSKLPKKIKHIMKNCKIIQYKCDLKDKSCNNDCDKTWKEIEILLKEIDQMDENIINASEKKDDGRWDVC